MRLPLAALRLTLLTLWPVLAAPAQAEELVFRPDRNCTAFPITRNGQVQRDQVGLRLRVGRDYEVLDVLDRVQLVVILDDQSTLAAVAVDQACGRVLDLDSPFGTADLDIPQLEEGPFFDLRTAGSPDPTPLPPDLSPFDEAVLDLCGTWGEEDVDQRDFEALLDREDIGAPVVDRLEAVLDGHLLGARLPRFRIADRVSDLWFRQEGFRHIFCGEPEDRRLGGLHFAARLLQAQRNGWALRVATNAEAIEPPIYSVGVLARAEAPFACIKCRTSYHAHWRAEDLLEALTLAADRAIRVGGNDPGLCVFEHGNRRLVAETFGVAVVVRRRGIVTGFPVTDPENYACDANGCGCRYEGPRGRCQTQCFRVPGETD